MEKTKDTEKQVRDIFNRLKSTYDLSWDFVNHTLHVGIFTHNDESLATAFKNTNKYLNCLIEIYLPLNNQSKILDVCTGTGRTLLELTKEYGCLGVGIDISEEQIKDARLSNNGKCEFILGSASELRNHLSENDFTHIVSQDGLFLVHNKVRCFQEIYDCLVPGGVFVFSDFLAEISKEKVEIKRKAGVYEVVKWEKGFSHTDYINTLTEIGFSIFHSERRGDDMIRTYEKLISQTKMLLAEDQITSDKLVSRYQSIVDSVRNKELDWGWFVAKK